jgi:tetratricopeptide (TPR) repeat protein
MRDLILVLALGLPISNVSGAAVRIDIKGEISGDSHSGASRIIEIFHERAIIPDGQVGEIFTGPYTIQFEISEIDSDTYKVSTSFFGLGPEYHTINYNLMLAVSESTLVPPLPLRNNAQVKYTFKLLDDTTTLDQTLPPFGDSTAWGNSMSVHYNTHWLKGSLADYMWNVKVGHLERIYDGYRNTFSVSSFDKIDYRFYPEPTNMAGIDLNTGYSIQPRKMKIDVLYGHEYDGATPAAAAELLTYRLWGYGPRWMVLGFSGYYFDNFLKLRNAAGRFDAAKLAEMLVDINWVESDSGRLVTGAFARWLIDKFTAAKYMEVYKGSTEIDFGSKFEDIYKLELEKALSDFLHYSSEYKPRPGELGYYASTYMDLGEYEKARVYLEETEIGGGDDRARFHQPLIICQYWLGDYDAAIRTIGSGPQGPECQSLRNSLNVANGMEPYSAFHRCAETERHGESILALTSSYLDRGNIAAAESTLANLNEEDKGRIEYHIEAAKLEIIRGHNADSLLTSAAAMALNRAQLTPHDPVNYLEAGQAFMLLGNFDRARENLETSYFLERRPYFLGLVFLELGRLHDLMGKRNDAREYYGQVLEINSGAYQKSLARGYLEKKYAIK